MAKLKLAEVVRLRNGCLVRLRLPSLEPRLSVPDFVSQLWRCLKNSACETKSGTESLGSRLKITNNFNCRHCNENIRASTCIKIYMKPNNIQQSTSHCGHHCAKSVCDYNNHSLYSLLCKLSRYLFQFDSCHLFTITASCAHFVKSKRLLTMSMWLVLKLATL